MNTITFAREEIIWFCMFEKNVLKTKKDIHSFDTGFLDLLSLVSSVGQMLQDRRQGSSYLNSIFKETDVIDYAMSYIELYIAPELRIASTTFLQENSFDNGLLERLNELIQLPSTPQFLEVFFWNTSHVIC